MLPSLIGLLLPFACTDKVPVDTAPPIDPMAWAVDEWGPYSTGFRSWSLEYAAPPDGQARTINVNIWYPTEDETGDSVAYMGVFTDPNVLGDASAADPLYGGSYPVHVHSHGFQGWGGTSNNMMQYFASHGWVAIAPDHLGNTLLDHSDPLPTVHYVQRPADISAALDVLEGLPQDDPLSAADTSKVVMSGHSFGTYTTWASAGATYDLGVLETSCQNFYEGRPCTEAELSAFGSGELSDARVVAAIPMAGGLRRQFFGEQGHQGVHAPFLYMTGSQDDVGLTEQWPGYEGVDRTWIDVAGGCHQTFATGVCSDLDADEGYQIINTYALSFARAHVLGDADPRVLGILDGSERVSDKVVFQRGE